MFTSFSSVYSDNRSLREAISTNHVICAIALMHARLGLAQWERKHLCAWVAIIDESSTL